CLSEAIIIFPPAIDFNLYLKGEILSVITYGPASQGSCFFFLCAIFSTNSPTSKPFCGSGFSPSSLLISSALSFTVALTLSTSAKHGFKWNLFRA
ncbi:hypothetical protein ADUPG1_005355, partial [Aduncisulcus paluster]